MYQDGQSLDQDYSFCAPLYQDGQPLDQDYSFCARQASVLAQSIIRCCNSCEQKPFRVLLSLVQCSWK